MKTIHLFLLSLLFSTISYAQSSDTDWKLVFEDNFNKGLKKWTTWYGGAFNNEVQLYNYKQVRTKDGKLIITAKRKKTVGPKTPYEPTKEKQFKYVSGRIESKKSFGPKDENDNSIFKISARIKLPKGKGMWPAFWAYNDPWPTKGEIDILEARGGNPYSYQSNIFYGTQGGKNIAEHHHTEKTYTVKDDLTEDFHIYELTWSREKLIISLDDEIMHTYLADSHNYVASLRQQRIALNLAVGGAFFKDKNADNFADSATMEVDWVKVYKK